jgi:hypothetical protein
MEYYVLIVWAKWREYKMNKRFNLSVKIINLAEGENFKDELIPIDDIKEFIKNFEEEIKRSYHFNFEQEEEIINLIEKLAGDKLI